MSNNEREAFDAWWTNRPFLMFEKEKESCWKTWQAARASVPVPAKTGAEINAEIVGRKAQEMYNAAQGVPVQESVDLCLIDDAITKITKAAANLVNGEGFTSSFEEDHRKTTPRWVLDCFKQDDAKRVWLGQEIAQGINWVRNATCKLREAKRNGIEDGQS